MSPRTWVLLDDRPGNSTQSLGLADAFSLVAVLPGRPETIPLAERDAGKEQLALRAGGAAFVAFVQSLYENADIVINEDMVAAADLLQ